MKPCQRLLLDSTRRTPKRARLGVYKDRTLGSGNFPCGVANENSPEAWNIPLKEAIILSELDKLKGLNIKLK